MLRDCVQSTLSPLMGQKAIGVDAAEYGFLPTATGAENVAAFNSIGGNKTISISIPGTYEIDGTLWLESDQHLYFCEGCTIKKMPNAGSPYTHTFANVGVLTGTRNRNISIYGNGLELERNHIDGQQAESIAYAGRGDCFFFRIDRLVLDGLSQNYEYTTSLFSFQFSDVNNFLIRNMSVTGYKDSYHFNGKCHHGIIEDVYSDTEDDSFAFIVPDYYSIMPCVGDIHDITIRRWTNQTLTYDGSLGRIFPMMWAVWESGNTYNQSDMCVNDGNIYLSRTVGAIEAANAPTHTSGNVTGADGIEWKWMQAGTITEGNVYNITFEDCDFHTSGTQGFAAFLDNTNDLRCAYPGTEQNGYMKNIIFDNIRLTTTNNPFLFWNGGCRMKGEFTLKNSTIAFTNTASWFWFNPLGTDIVEDTYMDNLTIENCNLTFDASSKLGTVWGDSHIVDVLLKDSTLIGTGDNDLYYGFDDENCALRIESCNISGWKSLVTKGHLYADFAITAEDTVFGEFEFIYDHTSTGGTVSFTSDGCTFQDPSGAHLFESDRVGFTVDVTNSTGAITQMKLIDKWVAFLNLDLLTDVGVDADILTNGDFTSDLSWWEVAQTPPNGITEWSALYGGSVHLKRVASADTAVRKTALLDLSLFYRSIINCPSEVSEKVVQEIGSSIIESVLQGKHVYFNQCLGSTRYGLRAYTNSTEAYVSDAIVQPVTTPPVILESANTVAWFDYLENITKDGSERISAWGDKSGNNRHLLQAGADALKPLLTATGVLCDGIDDFMKTAQFGLEQPEFIYMVVNQKTWNVNAAIFAAVAAGNPYYANGSVFNHAGTPGIKGMAASLGTQDDGLTLDSYHILRVLYNGASSKLIVDDNTPTTDDLGANDLDGFSIGSRDLAWYSNVEFKEIILRDSADSAANEATIYAYLKHKYGL